MENLDIFFDLMKDGRWHDLVEIARNMQLSKNRVEKIVHLFVNANFATFNQNTKK